MSIFPDLGVKIPETRDPLQSVTMSPTPLPVCRRSQSQMSESRDRLLRQKLRFSCPFRASGANRGGLAFRDASTQTPIQAWHAQTRRRRYRGRLAKPFERKVFQRTSNAISNAEPTYGRSCICGVRYSRICLYGGRFGQSGASKAAAKYVAGSISLPARLGHLSLQDKLVELVFVIASSAFGDMCRGNPLGSERITATSRLFHSKRSRSED